MAYGITRNKEGEIMQYIILGTVIGLCFFISTVKAYSLGLSHGKQLSNGTVPQVNLNPVKAVTKAVETHQQKKESDKLSDELSAVLGYSYNSALDAVKKEA
jgi:hypothetical protein